MRESSKAKNPCLPTTLDIFRLTEAMRGLGFLPGLSTKPCRNAELSSTVR